MVTRKRFDPRSALPGSPFLTHVTLREDRVQPGVHPFTVPWLLPSLDLQLSAPVTFLVGENGTGKSTLLEAIAWSVGFGAQGGNRDQSFAENADGYALGRALRLSWRQKVSGGFFLRAETFFNFATYLEDVGSPFHRIRWQIVAPTIPRRSIPFAVSASLRRRLVPSGRTGSCALTSAATGVSTRPARPDCSKNCAVRDCDPFTDVAHISGRNDFQSRCGANSASCVRGDGSFPDHKGFSKRA